MGLENPLHIALVLVVVLVIFGAKRLPEVGQSLGSGLRGFKDALTGERPSAPPHQLSAASDTADVGAADVAQAGAGAASVSIADVGATRPGAAPGAQRRQ